MRVHSIAGFTLIEIMLAIMVIGLLLSIAVPGYQDYQDRVEINEVITDLQALRLTIESYRIDTGNPPPSLATVGMDGMTDPWGNPYQYVDHTTAPNGHRRKDKNLVPINSFYDLYSSGEDGASRAPLTAKASRDDIIMANDGGYFGLAEDY